MKEKNKLPEKIWVTEDHNGMDKGSCIYVETETETTYTGTWSFRGGSHEVTVEKKYCEERKKKTKTKRKRLLVFNSGSGSGFQELVENSRTGVLSAEIVGLVTNKSTYTCLKRAMNLDILFAPPMTQFEAKDYKKLVKFFNAEYIALSGWLKPTKGLDPRKTFNIHPGPLPEFGAKGMYGHHVHEAVIKAYKKGLITESAVTMHFVTKEYDKGPVFFRYPVLIRPDDDADSLGSRVNKIEHGWQSFVTNLVVTGQIHWDGENSESLVVPEFMKKFL